MFTLKRNSSCPPVGDDLRLITVLAIIPVTVKDGVIESVAMCDTDDGEKLLDAKDLIDDWQSGLFNWDGE